MLTAYMQGVSDRKRYRGRYEKKHFNSFAIGLMAVMISCGGYDPDDVSDTCPDNDKFCHYNDGMYWSDLSSYEMDWDEAATYCYNLGGSLSTISEIRTLIQNCPATVTDGECAVTDDCLSSDCWSESCYVCDPDKFDKYSVFGDTAWLWSSSSYVFSTPAAWGVHFSNGCVDSYKKTSMGYARCIL